MLSARIFCLAPALLLAQSQSFDAYTYETPGPGYVQRSAPNAVEWSKINQQRKYYCQIVLYRAQASVGTAAQNLEAEWKAVVTQQFRVTTTSASKDLPLPHAPASIVRGAESIDGNGNKALNSLFVLGFPNRYVGVLFNAPNAEAFEACQADVTRVVLSLRLTGNTTAPPAPAPQAPVAAVPRGGGVVGTWQKVIATQPAMKYNMFTKQYEYDPVAAMRQFKQVRQFQFAADGTYTYDLDAEDYNRSERSRVIERGTYKLVGSEIHFQPTEMLDGVGKRGTDPPLRRKPTPAGHARKYLIGEHPQYQGSPGLQLADGNGWETYKPVQ